MRVSGTIGGKKRPSAMIPMQISILLSISQFTPIAAQNKTDDQGSRGWITARATWYDDSPQMTVHTGSCEFGFLGERFGGSNNWMVAAMNDGNKDFSGSEQGSQCGTCYEIQCDARDFYDGYGTLIHRKTACNRETGSFMVTITDTCPCSKPGNEYSNKRWCCGDLPHFDLGVWAFKRMADPTIGVIGIKYRKVTCSTGSGVTVKGGRKLMFGA